MFIRFSEPSRVRNLKCYCDRQNNDKIICTWIEPEYIYDPIQLYHVQLVNNEQIIHTHETPDKRFEWAGALQHGGIYSIYVKAKTNIWGEDASTQFRYLKSGELHFLVKKKNTNISM